MAHLNAYTHALSSDLWKTVSRFLESRNTLVGFGKSNFVWAVHHSLLNANHWLTVAKYQHEVIDASSRAYNLPRPAAALFESITSLESDLFAILTDFSKLSDNARKILALTGDREISFSDHWELHKGLSSNTQDTIFKAFLERENFFPPRFKFDAKRYIDMWENFPPGSNLGLNPDMLI